MTDPTPEAVEQHVREVVFDPQAEPSPDCILCKAASAGRMWQSLGFDDPLTEDAGRG